MRGPELGPPQAALQKPGDEPIWPLATGVVVTLPCPSGLATAALDNQRAGSVAGMAWRPRARLLSWATWQDGLPRAQWPREEGVTSLLGFTTSWHRWS